VIGLKFSKSTQNVETVLPFRSNADARAVAHSLRTVSVQQVQLAQKPTTAPQQRSIDIHLEKDRVRGAALAIQVHSQPPAHPPKNVSKNRTIIWDINDYLGH
jgi:hypothetical protein